MIRAPENHHEWQQVHALLRAMGEWDAGEVAVHGIPRDETLAAYYGDTVETLIQSFSQPRAGLRIALDGAAVAGCAGYSCDGPTATVHKLFVDPIHRGKGLGYVLIEAVLDAARQDGATEIRLVTATFMRSAIALYRRHGFQDVAPFEYSDTPALRRLNVYLSRKL